MAPIPNANTERPNEHGDEVSDMETPPVNIAVESEESEEDEAGYMGYQMLAQDPDMADDMQNAYEHGDPPAATDPLDQAIAQTLHHHEYPFVGSSIPDAGPDAEALERREVWSAPRPMNPMSAEEADKIKTAMTSFTLPLCAQPDWAKSVTEDEWKQRLYAKLNIPTPTKSPTSTNENSTMTSCNDSIDNVCFEATGGSEKAKGSCEQKTAEPDSYACNEQTVNISDNG